MALEPAPFWAVNVIAYAPPVAAAGVPLSTPVAGVKVTPVGRAPDTESEGAGTPDAVTVKEPAVPTTNVAFEPLVIAGA